MGFAQRVMKHTTRLEGDTCKQAPSILQPEQSPSILYLDTGQNLVYYEAVNIFYSPSSFTRLRTS